MGKVLTATWFLSENDTSSVFFHVEIILFFTSLVSRRLKVDACLVPLCPSSPLFLYHSFTLTLTLKLVPASPHL